MQLCCKEMFLKMISVIDDQTMGNAISEVDLVSIHFKKILPMFNLGRSLECFFMQMIM